MSSRPWILAVLASAAAAGSLCGQVGDANPTPCLDTSGPTAAVTALAFSPDGQTLFSAGYDKVVRVWRRNPNTKAFEPDSRATFRVPIGPGRDGVINVLAVSPDGTRLAVSGLGVYKGTSDFARPGWIVADDALSPEMRQERFMITVFDIQSHAVALLRGHEEDVLALAFAPAQPGQPQLLVSAGRKSGASTGRVCVWDIARASALDESGKLVERGAKVQEWLVADIGAVPGEPPPGVAVRVTPDGHRRVVAAWGDGKLRMRDFDGSPPQSVDEPRNADGRPAEYTHSVLATPTALLTGGIVQGKGYVQAWDDAAGSSPRRTQLLQLNPPRGTSYMLPRAMCLVSPGDGRGIDHAALVLRSPPRQGAGQEYRLALFDLKNLRLVERPDEFALLGTWAKPPVVASSPDGRLLAVTVNHNREIRVFAANDLFGQMPLRDAGGRLAAIIDPGITSIAFAQKGDASELGLVLRTGPSEAVLDVGKRILAPNTVNQGWKTISPANVGWRVNQDANSPNVIHWAGPRSQGAARLRLQSSQAVTAYALIPPRPPLTDPIVAVATWDNKIGEPRLLLFLCRGRDGESTPVRQLNGHVQPIHALSATPDGRLLASAAEDQTVSVWSLTDLADIVNRHATLTGIAFRPAEESPVVLHVDAESPSKAVLTADDVIQSVSFPGPGRQSRSVSTPLEFFETLWGEKPGEVVQLQVRRRGADQTVDLTLEQGVDERKPLVSLFVSRDRMPDWIAWSPLGPYDASSRNAERYLGWHFNPAKLGEPVRFAQADAYRERLHKPGLFKALLTYANLTDALRDLDKPVAVPRATMFCAIDDVDPLRFGGGAADQILVRQPRVTLRLRVQGPSIEKKEVESITWRINDGEPRSMPLESASGETLVQPVDLSARGLYRVQVCLRTREAEPQEVTRDLMLRYQPPPPKIQWVNPTESRLVVREAQFRLKAIAELGLAGQKVAVRLRKGQDEPQPRELNVDESLTLAPGENVLELRAANESALRGYEEYETAQRSVVLVYQPKEAPQILLSSLAGPNPAVSIEPGRSVTVGAGKVRIQGRIAAIEPLAVATLGDRPLAGFQPNSAKEFAIDEEIALKPDDQEFRFRAKTANSVEAETRLRVVYRPPLPTLTLTEPDPDRSLTEGKDAQEVELKGTLTPPDGLAMADLQPYQLIIRVTNNGKPVPQNGGNEIAIPSDRLEPVGAVVTKVRLSPGDNRIDAVVRNRWQEAPTIERHVFYRRPPRFTGALTVSPPGEKPFTDVVAEVESVSDLTQVECNGREYPIGEVAKRMRDNSWRVTIAQVPLTTGPNAIKLRVSNRDGPALAEGRTTVEFTPPKPKAPPRVELANRPQGAVKEPAFTARFVVRSAGSRIQRIELRQDTRVISAVTDPKQEPDGPDAFTASGQLGPVALQEGANPFRLVAVNGGGETVESFSVAHVPVPEWLEIDRPSSPLPQAEFTLTGRVHWSGAVRAEEIERKLQKLRVYVNSGFQQQTPSIRPAGPNRVEFSVGAILNRSENLIEVVCPDLRPEAGGQQRFTVSCTKPREEPRTLHLLVVAITPARAESTDKALALRALKALQARGAGAQGLKSTVFNQVLMHPYTKDQPTQIVSGYVTCEHIRDALESIRRHSKPNDVALIYWLGSEALDEGGNLFLHTSESRPGRKLAHSAIGLKEILEFPRDTPGACALLLDTAGAGSQPDAPSVAPLPSTRVAVLRYAWSGKGMTIPGLLMALEEASQKRDATALQDLATIAARSRQEFKEIPAWEDNLKDLPALAELVISRKP